MLSPDLNAMRVQHPTRFRVITANPNIVRVPLRLLWIRWFAENWSWAGHGEGAEMITIERLIGTNPNQTILQ